MTKAKVKKGSHLTVTTHPNGKVELSWDWKALAEEVATACASISAHIQEVQVTAEKKKRTKKKVD